MCTIKVLFVSGSINPERGGVARVCCNLSMGLKANGINTYSITTAKDSDGFFDESIQFEEPNEMSQKNKNQILSFFNKHHFTHVILENPQLEWMLDATSILKGKAVLIGEYHNSPFGVYGCLSSNSFLSVLNSKKWFRSIVFRYRAIKMHSYWNKVSDVLDHMVLLSDSYYDELNVLASFPRNKVSAIPNPFPPISYNEPKEKQNTIVFVGRLSGVQKGISKMLNIWKSLYVRLPQWKLKIVGGGEELDKWKRKAELMGLKNIYFEGFQTPDKYYSEAKIFMMTSIYEGFPMTLVEAMQYGCVPVVFDSFSGLKDIIDNNKNGLSIKAFDEKAYSRAIISLAEGYSLWNSLSMCAIEKSKYFLLDEIVKEWVALFKKLSSI